MYNLSMQDVSFSYDGKNLTLNEINLDIENPQLISIVGPNGVGKSTLIHCMNRILSPTQGTVFVDGEDVNNIKIKDLAKKMGYVPYSANDTFPLTVVDTILMGRNPHNKLRSNLHADMQIVKEILDLMDIRDLAMRPFNELSAGQHQRVMLARGLAQEPKIILLDEPTANLDIKHQMDVIRILKRLSITKGIIVIMISHDLNLAARYSDNIIMMANGTVYSVGRPNEVITRENIKSVYGVDAEVLNRDGRPVTILIDSDLNDNDLVIPDNAVVQRHATAKDVRAG